MTQMNTQSPYTSHGTNIYYVGVPFAVCLSDNAAQMTALALNTLWQMRRTIAQADEIVAQADAQIKAKYGIDVSKMSADQILDKMMEIVGAAIDTKDTQEATPAPAPATA